MNLAAILSDPELGGTTFYVFRPSYTKVMGEVVPSITTDTIVKGNIQPASSEDLQLFPQEERSEEMIVILASYPFSLGEAGEGSFTSADIVNWQGRKYRVVRVKDWFPHGGYYKAWAVRQKE